MSKTLELLGSVKVIRAISDLTYKGKLIRGRRNDRTDGKGGAYEIVSTPGEELEVEQSFGKLTVLSGKAELVSGGYCEVVFEQDGYHRYTDWRRKDSDPAPIYERVEFLKQGGMAGGPFWPAGFKCRLDANTFLDRSTICYEDEQQTDYHTIRVLKPSPKQVQLNAIEQAGMVKTMWSKLFPEKTA
jgi:hypothetical protein